MSIFDGLTGVLNAAFGAPVTINPAVGAAVTTRGIFREVLEFQADGDDRAHPVPMFVLQVPKPIPAALVRGSTVEGDAVPGTFRVSGVWPDRSPAADAFMVAHLEKIG